MLLEICVYYLHPNSFNDSLAIAKSVFVLKIYSEFQGSNFKSKTNEENISPIIIKLKNIGYNTARIPFSL